MNLGALCRSKFPRSPEEEEDTSETVDGGNQWIDASLEWCLQPKSQNRLSSDDLLDTFSINREQGYVVGGDWLKLLHRYSDPTVR
ncbi:hypothetical protein BaRGS_00001054 [Batillaria attramentaria]|uniref:Uncharacterized protein n=1 Tax=Batillaria attramentaria TaxID=370345 RepID=A0ABD0M5U5_9CAEN